MKLSISNIAWGKENDEEMYRFLSNSKIDAIEIAPTRIIEDNPYYHVEEAKQFSQKLYEKYNLKISSIQSIWYGRQERIFGNLEEREFLINYTKKIIDFAHEINCSNIVFGCPKNRIINSVEKEYIIAKNFFNEIGNYANSQNVFFSIEANPTIYNTNFITTTLEAINMVKELNNFGIKINLDVGTMIENKEDINILKNNICEINHVHISEPNLENIKERTLHNDLIKMLKSNNYKGYISIEMKNQNDIEKVKKTVNYIKNIAY